MLMNMSKGGVMLADTRYDGGDVSLVRGKWAQWRRGNFGERNGGWGDAG